MHEPQSAADHPRSDDVRGRQEGGYEDAGGFGDRGYGDRGGFGDQGSTGEQSAGPSAERDANAHAAGDGGGDGGGSGQGGGDVGAPPTVDRSAEAEQAVPPVGGGGYADQDDYGDLPRER